MSILAPQPAPSNQPRVPRMPINAVLRLIQRFYPSGGVIPPPSVKSFSMGFILQNNSIYTSRGIYFFSLKPLFFYFPSCPGGFFSKCPYFFIPIRPPLFSTHPPYNKQKHIVYTLRRQITHSSVFTTFVLGAPFFILPSGGIFYFCYRYPLFFFLRVTVFVFFIFGEGRGFLTNDWGRGFLFRVKVTR